MADTSDLYARGLRRRKKMFGETEVEARMGASGEFGAPLQNVINAYVYGDVWERDGLSDDVRSLVMLAITAASDRPAEFRVHAQGRARPTVARERRCRTCCCWSRCIAAFRPRSKPTRLRRRSSAGLRQALPARRNRRRNEAMKSVPTIDAHHHVWRLDDLPWLSGPQVPRIFGPYQPICRDYTIDEYRDDLSGMRRRQVGVCPDQLAGRAKATTKRDGCSRSRTRRAGRRPASRTPISPMHDAGALLARLAKLPMTRGIRQQLHWHRKSAIPLCAAPRPDERRGVAARAGDARRSWAAVRNPDFCKPDGGRRAAGADRSRRPSFVLEHAGMLEDMSAEGLQLWREGMTALADCPNVHVKLSGLGTFRPRAAARN